VETFGRRFQFDITKPGYLRVHPPGLSNERLNPSQARQSSPCQVLLAWDWGNDIHIEPRRRFLHRHYSRISSVKRLFNFISTAPRIVRMDTAVRPRRPITLPRSSGCTRNSSNVTCSPFYGVGECASSSRWKVRVRKTGLEHSMRRWQGVYYRAAEKSRPESRLDYFHRKGER
jgi:hypothetical protein